MVVYIVGGMKGWWFFFGGSQVRKAVLLYSWMEVEKKTSTMLVLSAELPQELGI